MRVSGATLVMMFQETNMLISHRAQTLMSPCCGQLHIVIAGVSTNLAQSEQTVGYVSKTTPTAGHNFPPTTALVSTASLCPASTRELQKTMAE